jgi:c-di-GMP-binding flagellar brake protein YcgR
LINRGLLAAGTQIRLLHPEEKIYYTAIIIQAGESGFIINGAVADGKRLSIEPGLEFKIMALNNDAVYHFSSRVQEPSGEQEEEEYSFEYPTEICRQQRRGYVRLPCRLPVYCWPLDEARKELARMMIGGDTIPLEDPRFEGGLLDELNSCLPAAKYSTLDLSGGGVRMIGTEPPQRQKRLLLKICTEERERRFFLLEGRVIRINPLAIGSVNKYRVSAAFYNISHGLQEQIIRYIFSILRKRI